MRGGLGLCSPGRAFPRSAVPPLSSGTGAQAAGRARPRSASLEGARLFGTRKAAAALRREGSSFSPPQGSGNPGQIPAIPNTSPRVSSESTFLLKVALAKTDETITPSKLKGNGRSQSSREVDFFLKHVYLELERLQFH